MSSITIVGVGPGDPNLLTLKGRELIQAADVVAGFESVLAPVRQWITSEVYVMRYANQEEVLETLATEANRGKRCVVCVWGDVNFSARELVEQVRRRFAHVGLLPGISSIQVACARLGLTVEESLFITLHARSGYESALQEAVEAVRAGKRHVFILPRPWDMMPPAVARELMRQGVPSGVGVYVLERLTLSDEHTARYTLASLAESERDFSDLSMIVVPRGL